MESCPCSNQTDHNQAPNRNVLRAKPWQNTSCTTYFCEEHTTCPKATAAGAPPTVSLLEVPTSHPFFESLFLMSTSDGSYTSDGGYTSDGDLGSMYSVYSNHKRSRVPYLPSHSTHSIRRPGTAREYLQPHKTMLKVQPRQVFLHSQLLAYFSSLITSSSIYSRFTVKTFSPSLMDTDLGCSC
jgi:hypothetical protein